MKRLRLKTDHGLFYFYREGKAHYCFRNVTLNDSYFQQRVMEVFNAHLDDDEEVVAKELETKLNEEGRELGFRVTITEYDSPTPCTRWRLEWHKE